MSPRVKYSKMLGHIEFALEIRILIILMMKLQDAASKPCCSAVSWTSCDGRTNS